MIEELLAVAQNDGCFTPPVPEGNFTALGALTKVSSQHSLHTTKLSYLPIDYNLTYNECRLKLVITLTSILSY